MKFSWKIRFLVIVGSFIPLIIAMFVSLQGASSSLSTLNQERLTALRDTKLAQVDEILGSYQQSTHTIKHVAEKMIQDIDSPTFNDLFKSMNQ